MTQTEKPIPYTARLLKVAEAYSNAASVSLATLGTRLLKGGSRFHDIANGGDLNTKGYERCMQWFSDNWPEGLEWPPGVERPPATEAAVAAE